MAKLMHGVREASGYGTHAISLSRRESEFVHSLVEVGDDVVYIFDADRQTDEVWGYAGLAQLLVRKLAMGVAGRMEHTCTCVGNVGYDADEIEIVHELDSIVARALESEGYHTARTVRQIFLRLGIVAVALESAVVDPCNLWIGFEPLGYFLCVLAVARYAEMECFETEVEKETVHRRRDGTEVAHEL